MSLLLVMSGVALGQHNVAADITAEYRDINSGETMTIRFQSEKRMRFEGQFDGQSGALLFRDDNIYAIEGDEYIDLGAMKGMMQSVMAAFIDDEDAFDPARLGVTRTQQRERIAGFEGTVYEISYDDQNQTAVLTNDARLDELQRAFVEISRRFSDIAPAAGDAVLAGLSDERFEERTPLRLNTDEGIFELTSVDHSEINAAHFSLDGLRQGSLMPEGMGDINMQDAMKMLMDTMNSPEAQEALKGMFGGGR
ncbi:MAG: hypothetical protein ACK4IT_10545 [Thioalkalivibrionaceae bacterium]